MIRAPKASLTAEVKQQLARQVTSVHSRGTAGADACVQVLFFGTEVDDCYLEGRML